jgi:protein-L-isoaspartate(D-aspartate) O-methyltransferase
MLVLHRPVETAGIFHATAKFHYVNWPRSGLAEIVDEVYTIEVRPELGEIAQRRLAEAGCERVCLRFGDGFEGWPEASPFDAILVTACAEEVPPALLEQLAPRGRLVIPIGHPRAYQELQVIEKTQEGGFEVQHALPVAFVPLVHAC